MVDIYTNKLSSKTLVAVGALVTLAKFRADNNFGAVIPYGIRDSIKASARLLPECQWRAADADGC